MRTSKVVNTFVNLLDNYSKQYNKSGWVEKTPQHFLNCATIHKYVPKVHIVYIIRDGFEVLGSLKDRYLKYPELFSRYSTPEIGIKQWNKSIHLALKHKNNANVHIVNFDSFTLYPEKKMNLLCERVNLGFEKNMLSQESTWNIIDDRGEPWKSGANKVIKRPISKFDTMYSKEEQGYARSKLDLNSYNKLLEHCI